MTKVVADSSKTLWQKSSQNPQEVHKCAEVSHFEIEAKQRRSRPFWNWSQTKTKSAILKLKPNKDESAILNSRQTKKVNYQRVLVLQAESVTKGRIWNHATLFAKSGRRKAKNHETLLCKSGRKKTNRKSQNLGYIARIKTNVESVRCIKGRHTRSFNGCRFRGIGTATDRKSTETEIPFHQQLHSYGNPEANPIDSNTL